MRRFTMEQMVVAYQLEQMLYDFIAELDLNGSQDVGRFYTEDGAFVTPGGTHKGRGAIQQFYDTRNANVRKHQKDGERTGRHTFVNVRCVFESDDKATLFFTNVNYAGEGKAPVTGLQGPSAIADCSMKCERQPDGDWLFSEFAPKQALLGEDDFMKLMLSLAQK